MLTKGTFTVKYHLVCIITMLMMALLPFSAFAQTGVNNSGFQVVNLGIATAEVVATYHNKDGSTAAVQKVSIPVNSSYTFFGSTMVVPSSFDGSVALAANQPIAAIGNIVNKDYTLVGSYGAFNGGSNNINLPLIERNNFGINTWFNVENAGTSPATVTVTYIPGVIGNASVTDTATIAPGGTARFYQANKTALGDRFIGSAVITSNQPVVATVNQESANLLTYNGFTSASKTILAPLIASNNFGNYTGIQIQNVGSVAADVTINYSANTQTGIPGFDACQKPASSTFNLAAGASKTIIHTKGLANEGFDNQFATCRYVGSATVTSSQPLVGMVNQVNANALMASAYETINPMPVMTVTNAPLIQSNNYGTYSGIQLQNTGTEVASITVTYGANTVTTTEDGAAAPCAQPAAKTVKIAGGASYTLIQSQGDAELGFDTQFNGCRYIGSARIAASSGSVSAIVNQVISGSGDTLLTYGSFRER